MDISNKETVFSAPSLFKILIDEMSEALFSEEEIDVNLRGFLNGSEKGNYSLITVNRKLRAKGNTLRLPDNRHHLFHKLIRISNEFNFAKKNFNKYRALTQREREIMQLLAKGNSNPQIAEQLFISRYTVEQHRKHINHKLKIKSFSHLMQYCYAFDLV